MNTRPIVRLLAVLSLLSAGLPAQAAHLVPEGESARAGSAVPESLLQFTAGGHALGFAAGGMYAAAGDHTLHVEFPGANAVPPQADSNAGEQGRTAPLDRVTYAGLWNGITLAYAADAGGIYTTTYTLAPGADPADIRLQYNAPLSLNEDGGLTIGFVTGALTESAPIAWQEIAGRRAPVDASFRVTGREVTFALGAYDPGYALTIDPVLAWNTFLGGNSIDHATGITLDANGMIYVAGYSHGAWGSPVREYTNGSDMFAAKLTSSGALVWHTFLGGDGEEFGDGIAVDGSGNIYVTGTSTAAWGSPVRPYSGGAEGFVVKLNSSGDLAWNTFLGGSGYDETDAVAVDGSGNTYATGTSMASWGSPLRAYTDGNEAYAAKVSASGALVWNTFLGGAGNDGGTGIAVFTTGTVYVAGFSQSSWGSPQRAYSAGTDAFAAALSSSGALAWNTFLGGSGSDTGRGIAVDGDGRAYVTGYSTATWGTPVRAYAGGTEAFAVKLNSTGSLSWNSFLGGSGNDEAYEIAVDRGGKVYVAGESYASWGSPLRPHAGGREAYAAKLNSDGTIASTTFLGAADNDGGMDIAVDGSGTYVAGYSQSTWGSPVRAKSGAEDAYVARVNLPHTCGLETTEIFDLTGDCKTDVAVYRPSTGAWYIRNQYSTYFGSSGDVPFPGDYNGDGVTDIAVYRPATGAWYVRNQFTVYFGSAGDLPVPGDYDGDGTTDIAVYRPSTGAWYVRGQPSVGYGVSTDIPVPVDYDGDGATDIAVYRPSTGAWYIRNLYSAFFGSSADIPVPGDYDGDGMAEIAVYRPATGAWYIQGQPSVFYGMPTDIPVPGDYNGNGTADIAVFRPSTGAWYVRSQFSAFYGASGDIPLPEMGTGKAGTAP
jgi:hypothetical protein